MGQPFFYFCVAVTLLLLSSLTHGHPSHSHFHASRKSLHHRQGGTFLRILPLGDSITWGWDSGSGNGYRLYLEQLLKGDGDTIEYIGSLTNGDMVQNRNDGHIGQRILEILNNGLSTLSENPNLILLMAGTNDAIQNHDPQAMLNDLGTLVDTIHQRLSDVTIVVSQIPPNGNTTTNNIISTYNGYIPYLINDRVSRGYKILGVNMEDIPTSDLVDGTHPNDSGFKVMAYDWQAGVRKAISNGWIASRDTTSSKSTSNGDGVQGTNSLGVGRQCNGGTYWGSQTRIFNGFGSDVQTFHAEFDFKGDWTQGQAAGPTGNNTVILADVDGDGKDDYLLIDPYYGSTHAWTNVGTDSSPKWVDQGFIATGQQGTDGAGVRWADMNGDGRADYLWIDTNGDIYLWINYAFGAYNNRGKIAGFFGGNRQNTFFADLDGNGRADLIKVDDSGNAYTWLNMGSDLDPQWNQVGQFASGLGIDSAGVRFGDIDGDGKADLIHVNTDTSSQAWRSVGSVGQTPQLSSVGSISGDIYSRYGTRDNVTYAKIVGSGRADLVTINQPTGRIDLNINNCYGGGKISFGDINADGFADIFFINGRGATQCWLNNGQHPPAFTSIGQIAVGGGLGPDYTHIVDMNGDGGADYVQVDPATGAVHVNANCGLSPGCFIDMGIVYDGGGLGNGKGVTFADFNGDGRNDFLFVSPEGDVYLVDNLVDPDGQKYYMNNWKTWGIVATHQGTGAVREQYRFADINGDRFADILIVADYNGGVQEYENGQGVSGGHYYPYLALGTGYPGANVQFAPVFGSGRDDYLVVDPVTGTVDVWENQCPGGTDAGDGQPYGTSLTTGPAPPSVPTASGSGSGSGSSSSPTITASNTSLPPPPPTPTGSGPGEKGRDSCTVDPPSAPESASGAWLTASCNAPQVTDAFYNINQAQARWDAVDAQDALDQMTAAYTAWASNPGCDNDGRFLFDGFANNYFHLADSPYCWDITKDENCNTVKCNDPNYPGGWLVWDSMVSYHDLFRTFYIGLQDAENTLHSEVSSFTSAFVQLKDSDLAEGLLSLLSGLSGFPIGYFFARYVKDAVSEVVYESIHDGVNSAVAAAIGYAQMELEDSTSQLEANFAVDTLIGIYARSMYQAANLTLLNTLGNPLYGDHNRPNTFSQLAKGGALLAPLDQEKNAEMRDSAVKLMYGNLIAQTWNHTASDNGGYARKPFVLYIPNGAYKCGDHTTNALRLHGDSSSRNSVGGANTLASIVDDDTASRTNFCDQYGNTFFLLSTDGAENYILHGGEHDNLDGNQWGGITIEDIVTTSAQWFINNGYTNGATFDPTGGDLANLFADGVNTPGFFSLPVCTSIEQLTDNLSSMSHKDPTFPCGPSGGASSSCFDRIGFSGYAKGTCDVNVIVHHTYDDDGNLVGREVGITLKDDCGYNVDIVPETHLDPITPGVSPEPQLTAQGRLPQPMSVGIGSDQDSDGREPVVFNYGGSTWNSEQTTGTSCSLGKYDRPTGTFQVQCGFPC